jgi:hypothetical protein
MVNGIEPGGADRGAHRGRKNPKGGPNHGEKKRWLITWLIMMVDNGPPIFTSNDG